MAAEIFKQLKKELPGLQKNILLSRYTTFKIGGPAEYFFIASEKKHVIQAIVAAKKAKLPVFIFGSGSNLLVSDKGIKGLVVKLHNKKDIALKGKNIIEASAGVLMKNLVAFSLSKSLAGLEWAGGLPGTFGGALRGNAGAFGGEIKDSILQVHGLDDNLALKKFSKKQCRFSYRSSIFKEKNWIILSAKVKLKKGDKKNLIQIANSRINYRKEKHPLEYPSAGSIFKNVAVKDLAPTFQKDFADKVKQDPFPIVPSAWFIIGAGLAGKQIGQAQISQKHSNYIVNLGGAKAKDVLALIDVVKKEVAKKYGIKLEMEVQYLE